jgi:hypothetical protein
VLVAKQSLQIPSRLHRRHKPRGLLRGYKRLGLETAAEAARRVESQFHAEDRHAPRGRGGRFDMDGGME